MKRKLTLLLFFASITLLMECKHRPTDEEVIPVLPGPTNTPVCFSSDIQPLVISTCAKPGCHDAIYRKENIALTDYNSIRYRALKGELMKFAKYGSSEMHVNNPSPRSLVPMDAGSLAIIQKWINEGAPNSICNTCDTVNVKFSTHIQPFIKNSCLGCHNGSTGTKLSTYAEVQAKVTDGKLLCSISHGTGCLPMPQGGVKLSTCQLRMFRIWIDGGAPNN